MAVKADAQKRQIICDDRIGHRSHTLSLIIDSQSCLRCSFLSRRHIVIGNNEIEDDHLVCKCDSSLRNSFSFEGVEEGVRRKV